MMEMIQIKLQERNSTLTKRVEMIQIKPHKMTAGKEFHFDEESGNDTN